MFELNLAHFFVHEKSYPLDSIPDFGDQPGWYSKFEAFIRSKGYELIYLDNSGAWAFKPDGYHIGNGMSQRGLMHSCGSKANRLTIVRGFNLILSST